MNILYRASIKIQGTSLIAQLVKNLPAIRIAGDPSLIPRLRKSAGEGIGYPCQYSQASQSGSAGKEFACNARDLGSVPVLGRSPGEGNIPWRQERSGLENSMDYIVHGDAKSRTRLSDFHVISLLH